MLATSMRRSIVLNPPAQLVFPNVRIDCVWEGEGLCVFMCTCVCDRDKNFVCVFVHVCVRERKSDRDRKNLYLCIHFCACGRV